MRMSRSRSKGMSTQAPQWGRESEGLLRGEVSGVFLLCSGVQKCAINTTKLRNHD